MPERADGSVRCEFHQRFDLQSEVLNSRRFPKCELVRHRHSDITPEFFRNPNGALQQRPAPGPASARFSARRGGGGRLALPVLAAVLSVKDAGFASSLACRQQPSSPGRDSLSRFYLSADDKIQIRASEAKGSAAWLLGVFGRKLETFLRVFAYFSCSCARIRRPRRTRTAAPAAPAGSHGYVLRSSAKPSHASGSATAQRTAIGRNAAPPNLA